MAAYADPHKRVISDRRSSTLTLTVRRGMVEMEVCTNGYGDARFGLDDARIEELIGELRDKQIQLKE